MEDVSVKYAKEHLEELLARAARGEDVAIVDPAVGKIVLTATKDAAPPSASKPRRLGLLEGKVAPPPDDFFDAMSAEELKDWYGDDE